MRILKGTRGFQIQDVGSAGWTIPVPSVVNTGTFPRRDRQQPGTRIYYIDDTGGLDPIATGWVAPSSTVLGDVYFWDGTNIIDSDGSTTGAGAVAYGTDPLNPTGPIKPFKSWAYVAPREGASKDIGDITTNNLGVYDRDLFRSTFPDWWLFKRGVEKDLYDDLRNQFDATGRTATAIPAGIVVRAACGRNSTELAVIGAYGPLSAGRASLRHPQGNSFFGMNGTSPNYHDVFYFGILVNGMARDRALRPVDYNGKFLNHDTSIAGANFLNLDTKFTNVRFEDIHWWGSGPSIQWLTAMTTPTPGFTMHRCIITDSWDENAIIKGDVRRAAGDADQSWAATPVPTKLTFVTAGSGNTAAMVAATGLFTAAIAATYKMWYLLDVTATVPANGSIEVLLYQNGVELAGAYGSKVIVGTGVASDTYKLHGVIYTPVNLAINDTLEIYIRTTNASGTFTVLGNGFSRVQINQCADAGSQGFFIHTAKGSQFSITETIFARNGFNMSHLISSAMPDGTTRKTWNIFNHNLYFNGEADGTNCNLTGCVTLLGSAGDVLRCNVNITQNFIYNGYWQSILEHQTSTHIVSGAGKFNDNVFLRYVAVSGVNSIAHPGWGFNIGNGVFNYEIKRNIISEAVLAVPTTNSNFAFVLSASATPYFNESCLRWNDDIRGVVIDGNQMDCSGTGATKWPIQEINGSVMYHCQWNTPVTFTWPNTAALVGDVVTCTPTAGYSNTPGIAYQWVRFGVNATTYTVLTGETASTYTLVAADLTTASDGMPYHRAACIVTGITYPTGVGITGTIVSNNIISKPGATNPTAYGNSDANGGLNGAAILTEMVPAATNLSYAGSNLEYTTVANAAAANGWTNAAASLKTALQSYFVTVASTDGFNEYLNTVQGANPILTAMRRGAWDSRLTGKVLGNHVRGQRNMATI